MDLQPTSSRYGSITSTPKPGWAETDLIGPFRREFGVPVAFDTDVNAAALGEWRYGAAQGLDAVVYLTVGTGIGGGGLVGGRLLHGLVHPEMGHLRVPHDLGADPFAGACPYHGDCLEGLASGPAMAARWGQPAHTLPADHPGWALEAHYLAMALHNVVCALSPQRIVIGGGVMEQPHLLPRVRQELGRLLNGYIQAPGVLDDIEHYVVAPALGRRSGVIGALALAEQALRRDPRCGAGRYNRAICLTRRRRRRPHASGATGSNGRSARAAWASSTRPTTSGSIAPSRSRRSAARATTPPGNACGARPASPPASATRTSVSSSRWKRPTTACSWRWSC